WQPGAGGELLRVRTWPLRRHPALRAAVAGLGLLSGWLLATFTEAQLPYLDAFTTWGAIAATAMVARKLLENWLYWFVIDGVSLGMYLERGLYLTAALFAVYLVLVIVGYRTWRRSMSR
ncbi:MAG: nicotinamide mononucleotide transporter, partial [Gammaproteobacteria bacterium]|nr:nicotinamide mononucleotide transporter [Gammaproteobacteria bacterium]